MQNSALQAEVGSMKAQLTESNQSLQRVQDTFQSSRMETERLNKDIENKQMVISEIQVNFSAARKKENFHKCSNNQLIAYVIYKTLKKMHIPRNMEFD